MEKEGKRKFGQFWQVWASVDMFRQGNKLEKWEKRGKKNKKRGKN